jgi:hypothetical protein
MNRRDFLKSLLAIGATVSIPFETIATAPESVIDQAWAEALQSPALFYVREYGAITTEPFYDSFPDSRADFYNITAPTTLEEVKSLAESNHLARGVLEGALQDAGADDLAGLDEEGTDWVISQLADWVDGSPEPYDDEGLSFYGQDGQAYALSYFRDEFEYCEELNILIIEGECPGSSYFAAELQCSVEEANDIAEGMGIPVRFAWLGF